MEISRGYAPLFKTHVKGLAKVKIGAQEELSIGEIHQLIASSALKPNDGFLDYKMLLYDDAIRFEKNEDGSSFPEIPFASVLHLVTLPNFPDVCFIQFRRSTYRMYVILRFIKAKYISKVAKFICSWSNANVSDSEESVACTLEPSPPNNDKRLQVKKRTHNQPPVIVHRPNPTGSGPRNQCHRPKAEHTNKILKTEGTQTIIKKSVTNKSTGVGHSIHVHTNHFAPDEEKRVTAIAVKRHHSLPAPIKAEKAPLRKRSSSETSSGETEMAGNVEVNLHWQPGEYTIIVPRHRGWPPSKNARKRKMPKCHAPSHPRGVGRRIPYNTSDSSTSTTSSSSAADMVDMHGREVKTIYPSYMEPGRMSPRSRNNERLLHVLHKPLSL
ncbi:unnamed protein product [Hydatigera taeniaeformis]|uniref:DUF5733 domain-containing protein n=1 Tax=Hydatigena taeniaeformis TaxID=6205 RepID=A0A0R3WM83_HYDTA|nr:unnamed protein product [Hydatigera taeniaeformis]